MGRTAGRSRVPRSCHWREEKEKEKERETQRERVRTRKMEGDASDKNIAYMLQQDDPRGPYYH